MLFPNEALTISTYHAELMCISVCNPKKSLSQSVLAFTIRGLSSPRFPNIILPRLRDTPGDVIQVYFHAGI